MFFYKEAWCKNRPKLNLFRMVNFEDPGQQNRAFKALKV